MREVWKPVIGYEGRYEVSNFGRVKSLNYHREHTEKIMKPTKLSNNYMQVDLCKNGEIERNSVHVLVAKAFIPNPNNYTVVHHIDHNPQNNCVDNLEWMDEDTHRRVHGKKKVYQRLNGVLIRVWDSSVACEEEGFNFGCVRRCCRKERKTYKGFTWDEE